MRLLLKNSPLYYFILRSINRKYDSNFRAPAAVAMDKQTKQVSLILNPVMLEAFTPEDLKIVFEHEALHLVFKHLFASHHYSASLYNQATDYIINDNIPDLVQRYQELASATPSNEIFAKCCLAPFIAHLPELTGRKVRDMNSLELAEILKKHSVPSKTNFDDHNAGQQDGDTPEDGRQSSGPDQDDGLTQVSKPSADRIIQAAVEEASSRAEGLGNLPAFVMDHVLQYTKSNVNYKRIKQMFLNSVKELECERTWARANRKYPNQIRGKRTPSRPVLLAVIDTSGSMRDERIHQAIAGEIKALSAVSSELWVVTGDVREIMRMNVRGGKFKMEDLVFTGGGGTNLQFGIEAAKEIHADGVIFYTDGLDLPNINPKGLKLLFCIYPGGQAVKGHKNIKLPV
jgi:predicted metal-dependent peptidase